MVWSFSIQQSCSHRSWPVDQQRDGQTAYLCVLDVYQDLVLFSLLVAPVEASSCLQPIRQGGPTYLKALR